MASDDLPNDQDSMHSNSQTELSFDEVSKLFPVSIAEAATILGVGTNDLQRICKENGVPRWPYRKILAGKTVEDIKKEAAKEKKLLEEMGQLPTRDVSNPILVSKSGGATLVPMEGKQTQSDSLRQHPSILVRVRGVPTSTLRPLHIDHHSQLHRQFHLRVNMPTFLDDFRHGFPRNGLPAFSTQWWGNATSQETENQNLNTVDEDKNAQLPSGHLCLQQDDLSNAEHRIDYRKAKLREKNGDISNQSDLLPASVLARTRKKAVTNGRKGLGIAVTKGYGAYRLGEKDEALLRAVFNGFLPGLWTASLVT